jgi:hypothetical protein
VLARPDRGGATALHHAAANGHGTRAAPRQAASLRLIAPSLPHRDVGTCDRRSTSSELGFAHVRFHPSRSRFFGGGLSRGVHAHGVRVGVWRAGGGTGQLSGARSQRTPSRCCVTWAPTQRWWTAVIGSRCSVPRHRRCSGRCVLFGGRFD